MLGRPMPTKQTRPPGQGPRPATTSISLLNQPAISGSPRSRPTRTAPGPGSARPSARPRASPRIPRGACAVDPLVQPRRQRLGVAADPVPLQVEPVVTVVVALGVGGVGAARADDHRVHLDPRDQGPVGVGPDDLGVDQLLDDHDHPAGRERRLLLAAGQPQTWVLPAASARWAWTTATSGLRGGTANTGSPRTGRRPADVGVALGQVGLEVRPQRPERQLGGPGGIPPDHPEVAVLLQLQGRRVVVLDPPPDGVQRPDARVPHPGEHQLAAAPAPIIWS